MYNENIKAEFIKLVNDNNEDYAEIFKLSESLEELLKKDLFDFSLDELSTLFYNMNKSTWEELDNYSFLIEEYIDWSITQGYKRNNINPLITVQDEWYDKFVKIGG